MPFQALGEQVGQPGQRGVHLDAAPRASAAAWVRPRIEQVQRRGHVRGFHSGERVAVQRQAHAIDERAAEARPRRQHQHSGVAPPADALRLCDAAHVPVIADDERHCPASALGQRGAVGSSSTLNPVKLSGRFGDLSRTP